MDNKILKDIVAGLADEVKNEAVKAVKEFDDTKLRLMVSSEIDLLVKPLNDEIKTTSSLWVKIRNRIYIAALNHSFDLVLNKLKQSILKYKKAN